MYEGRTLDDFIEDMVSDGRTAGQVRAVACTTRWAPQTNEAHAKAQALWSRIKGKKNTLAGGEE